MRVSIFWRLTIGFLTIIALVTAVNLFALHQITELSTRLVADHYPAIESAKWLIDRLYAQVRSEKKYLAVRDEVFLAHFDDDAREFRHTLAALKDQESSADGQGARKDDKNPHHKYLILFHTEPRCHPKRGFKISKSYEPRRDRLVNGV